MGEKDFHDTLKFQSAIYDSILQNNNAEGLVGVFDIWNVENIYELIQRHFECFQSPENETTLLPLLHHSITKALRNQTNFEIGDWLSKLLEQKKNEPRGLRTVIQIIYQVLQSIKISAESYKEQQLDCNPFQILKLNDILFSDLLNLIWHSNLDKTLNANILMCVQLYVQQNMAKALIETLWKDISERNGKDKNIGSFDLQVLIHLFDEFVVFVPEFHQSKLLIKTTQWLLCSEEQGQRRKAYFLIKKVMELLIIKVSNNVTEWDMNILVELRQRWTTYLSVMVNLEENQSHLILPSLHALEKVDYNSLFWKEWSKILYRRILSHKNILVVRWTLEYFLKKFTCGQLEPEVLEQFLEATNNTSLYNLEGYFVKSENIKQFLSGKLDTFAEKLSQINWKSVPLHFWLEQIHKHTLFQQWSWETKTILQIASKIRALQNRNIRKKAIEVFLSMTTYPLTLDEFVTLIETLCNVGDEFDLNVYLSKLEKYATCSSNVCSKRFYEIVAKIILHKTFDYKRLISAIANIPVKKQGYLRFLIVLNAKDLPEVLEFCRLNYGINLLSINASSFRELNKLVQDPKEESLVHEISVDYLVNHCVKNFSEVLKLDLTVEDLLNQGSLSTLLRLSELIQDYERATDLILFNSFLKAIENKEAVKYGLFERISACLMNNFKITCERVVFEKRAIDLINISLEKNSYIQENSCLFQFVSFNVENCTKNILHGDAKTGDARIEENYACKIWSCTQKDLSFRTSLLSNISGNIASQVCKELLKMNADISAKKSRHFENSTDHRLKMRIVRAIIYLIRAFPGKLCFYEDGIWCELLEQTNQINVTCGFEYIIANIAPENEILKKLDEISKYTASQQVSIICVAHAFWNMGLSLNDPEVFIKRLLPSTMGANFQTRLYAQLAVLNLLEKHNYSSVQLFPSLKNSIKSTIGQQWTVLLKDIRLFLSTPYLDQNDLFGIVLYVTNAPYDEFKANKAVDYTQFGVSKDLFEKKIGNFGKTLLNEETLHFNIMSNIKPNVQIKMNPEDNIAWKHDLLSYQCCQNNEIYVIATLIDKLPNLGGIARTCEVLGIKNLVLKNKDDVKKSDFKNLSMTAEKNLNILEIKVEGLTKFLTQKQMEGYEIVGAEQTAESVSFVDFKFPKKTLLLLGHEKEGIPANLLDFLDHVVEIPQFGIVRSLNVHVTGAIFMWEYCKQHIAK